MARHTQHNVIYPLSTLIFRSVEMNSSCLRNMCVYYAILLYYSMLLWTLLNSLYGMAISYAFYIKHNSHNAHIIHSLAACLFVWHAPSHIATSTNVLFIHVCALCVCVVVCALSHPGWPTKKTGCYIHHFRILHIYTIRALDCQFCGCP